MSEGLYRFLKLTAIAMALAWVGWAAYDNFFRAKQPGDYQRAAAEKYFSDGHYEDALAEYDAALKANPDLLSAKWGKAETLIQMGREREAVEIYDELIVFQPDEPHHYANRGIAYDLLGEHELALSNYEKALSLDPEVGSGPHWLTRFLRNQPESPPGIGDRARYLRDQFALPPGERMLSDPELDGRQRPYKE